MSERYTPQLDKDFKAPTMPESNEADKNNTELFQVTEWTKEIGDRIDNLEQTYHSSKDERTKISIVNNLRVLAENVIRVSNSCK